MPNFKKLNYTATVPNIVGPNGTVVNRESGKKNWKYTKILLQNIVMASFFVSSSIINV